MFSFPQLLPDLPSFLLTQLHAPFSLSIKKSKQKNQDKNAKTKQEKHKKAHEVHFF